VKNSASLSSINKYIFNQIDSNKEETIDVIIAVSTYKKD